MKRVRIARVENSEQGLVGVLLIDGKADCFTLQPDPTDKHFSIPSGCYLCKRFHGYKYKDTFEIIVRGHKDLLFHPLNTEDQTEGCIGLGEEIGELDGKRAILSSGRAFSDFMRKMGEDREFNLSIEDCF